MAMVPMSMSSTKKRIHISIEEKVGIIKKYDIKEKETEGKC